MLNSNKLPPIGKLQPAITQVETFEFIVVLNEMRMIRIWPSEYMKNDYECIISIN